AAEPRRARRDAAEHARAFWVAWALGGAGLGLAGPLTAGVSWGGAGWLAFWVAAGSVQPSMLTDVLEVRRLRQRQASLPVAPEAAPLPPIHWRAPAGDEIAA